ncbi:MAG: glycosyltransferase family 8 protein [Myxacorys californica WJT36-NPBG1]|jgi:lipopolysaccharide biosynthesis glycosyltransferase|nr:glycosyltransferase family 8 protein [Myxacorys californica WJT36-NPBG1]
MLNRTHSSQFTPTTLDVPICSAQTISIVCAADDNYAMPLAALAYSVLANLNLAKRLELFVLDGGIRDSSKRKILKSIDQSRCQVHWLTPSEDLLKDMVISRHITIAAYYRLLIADLLPDHLDKVIYLDSDLVVDADIDLLWNTDFHGHCVLAVQDFALPDAAVGLLNYKSLGISSTSKYFNSGVLLIDLEKWRTESIGARTLEYLTKHKEFVRYHDQDGLNVTLAGQWGELDPRWNSQGYLHQFSSWEDSPFSETVFNNLTNQPYIVHFTAGYKPWNCRHHSEQDWFYKYLDKTEWAGWRFPLWRAIWRKLIQIMTQHTN